MRAAGLTVEELEAQLAQLLETYLEEPQVAVSVTEFRSQPVSVVGAVTNPGSYQLRGGKSLLEILSLAGGLRPDAGQIVRITRQLSWGRIPVPTATEDLTGRVSLVDINLRSVMQSKNADENLELRPNDIISVPRADMVYVMGDVAKPGGFVLSERGTVSALQALSLAGGLSRTAAPQHAKILRDSGNAPARNELPIDLKRILAGKASDVMLQPEDILFVPNNSAKSAGLRAVEAAIQVGTGVVIWRR